MQKIRRGAGREGIPSVRACSGWPDGINRRYSVSLITAAVRANREMLLFFWSLGRDIATSQSRQKQSTSFYRTLSNDLADVFPGVKGLSVSNLDYMKRFYLLVEDVRNIQQPAGQTVADTEQPVFPQVVGKIEPDSEQPIFPQVVGKIEEPFFSIPWGHIRLIIDKYGNDAERALFWAKKTVENNWSQNVLLNFLDVRLYERQGNTVTAFQPVLLPMPQGDLAREMIHDPYVFDFIAVRGQYHEREAKDALMNSIQRFFLERGSGFALLGREYRLVAGETEYFPDFLFYHAKLHCYIVIDVKTGKPEAGDMGQLCTCIAAVNGMLKQKEDAPTIGLLMYKTEDNVTARYAFSANNVPDGLSEYKLTNLVPDKFKEVLPAIEEIEAGLYAGADTGSYIKTAE